MSVKLVLKSAAQCVEDISLYCELDWTISQVKDEITKIYPTNPAKDQQKLIYAGKLLPNDLCLKSILNHSQDYHVLHLVCPLPPMEFEKSKVVDQVNVPPPVYAPPAFDASRTHPQFYSPAVSGGLSFVPTPEYFAMQQMYTQMMSQYFAQMTGYPAYTQAPPPMAPPPQPLPQQRHAPNRADGEDVDMLDYVYLLFRVAMMFALFYYYSSFSRVVAVACFVVFINWIINLTKVYRRQAEAQRVLNNAGHQQESQNSENQDEEFAETDIPPSPSPEEPPRSTLGTIFSLVCSFFSSLVPNDPPPVNVN